MHFVAKRLACYGGDDGVDEADQVTGSQFNAEVRVAAADADGGQAGERFVEDDGDCRMDLTIVSAMTSRWREAVSIVKTGSSCGKIL